MTDENLSTSQAPVDTRPAPPSEWPKLPEDDMLERVIEILASEGQLERGDITPDATLESLGLASIDVVSILMGVEEEFDVYLPMSDELSEARNLAELITVVFDQMEPDELKDLQPKSS